MSKSRKPIVCAISASDNSAHAGHQCDLRVIQDLDCHGVGIISGLTAQNSLRVLQVEATSDELFTAQIQALQEDVRPDAIKTGLLLSKRQMDQTLKLAEALGCPLIVDPVLASSSGCDFSKQEVLEAYPQLLAHASVITPNLPEAELLTGMRLLSHDDIAAAAQRLRQQGAKTVLIKGGHQHPPTDYLFDYYDDGQQQLWLRQTRQNSQHTRGTGCTLASAIASFMAQGKSTLDAVVLASAYVQQGIQAGFAVGHGPGLLANGGWPKQLSDFPTPSPEPQIANPVPFASCDTHELGLYPIVDSLDWLQRLLELGVKTLQLRLKDIDSVDQLNNGIQAAVDLGERYQARLFINDHWQLAIQHKAYGVHLGQEDLNEACLDSLRSSGLRLGLSAHSEYEWLRAARLQPSYIALGSVFPTATKSVKTIGLDNLRSWAEILSPHFPLVAIGGIDANNINTVRQCGVGSTAVISAITQADDAAETVTLLLQG